MPSFRLVSMPPFVAQVEERKLDKTLCKTRMCSFWLSGCQRIREVNMNNFPAGPGPGGRPPTTVDRRSYRSRRGGRGFLIDRFSLTSGLLRGCCRRAQCSFAHGEEELTQPPDLSMTARCAFGERCRKRSTCRFAHTTSELRSREASAAPPVCTPKPLGEHSHGGSYVQAL